MQNETPPASLTGAVSAGGAVVRLGATLRQTEQAFAELASLEGLLSSMSLGAADLIRASTTPVETAQTKGSLMIHKAAERDRAELASTQALDEPSAYECEVQRAWCSALERENVFYSTGLSTSFSALERSVSDIMVLALSSKLQRVAEKVGQLCTTLDERAQKTRQKQKLPLERAMLVCEAVHTIHQFAHVSLEPEDAESRKRSVATPCASSHSPQLITENPEKSRVFPATHDADWWNVYAGLDGVLHRATPSRGSSAQGGNEEVVEGQLELQRKRLLGLLQEMTTWLIDDKGATR
ncbi:hypothetical protein JKF63_00827 [Porcisia hertigi]|uniref:Uncharacterized protein n=1 Tax=Porcisia hertigi TaxID=2761500 RepID=A0A836I8Y3_9TRYP|nr:hypothetical protein JKF63_00827 [Porcisia hertigi]